MHPYTRVGTPCHQRRVQQKADRVVVFIDYQNVHFGALRAFWPANTSPARGHISPRALGELLVAKRAAKLGRLGAAACIVDHMRPSASDELLDRYGAVLADLASRHGLSGLRHGGPGTIVADVEPGRTLSDLARFELEAESLIGYGVHVVSSDAPAAGRLAGRPLKAAHAA